jgi:hypothetical protein
MSVNLMSAIFEAEFFDLKDENENITKASTAKLILLAMADHANDEGEGAYPSIERLCRKTALSAQTIRNTFDALRFNGIISLEGKSKYGTNNHTINTKSFPKAIGKETVYLTLYPLDPLMSTATPLTSEVGVNYSLDPNHPLTIIESSAENLKTDEVKGKYKTALPAGSSLDWQIATDQPITQEGLDLAALKDEAPKMFEKAFGTGQWPWWSNLVWEKFARFVVEVYSKDKTAFGNYIVWRAGEGKYTGFSNKKIRENPVAFMDTGWPEFESNNKQSKTETKLDKHGIPESW